MKVVIGSDHAGISLKKLIIKTFDTVEFIDVGTNSPDSCDYPDYIEPVGHKVISGEADKGIAICGSGIGASITVNKVKGVRGALCMNQYMAEMSRRHKNANVLVLGARVTGEDLNLAIIETWFNSEFEGGRHQRRLDKIGTIES